MATTIGPNEILIGTGPIAGSIIVLERTYRVRLADGRETGAHLTMAAAVAAAEGGVWADAPYPGAYGHEMTERALSYNVTAADIVDETPKGASKAAPVVDLAARKRKKEAQEAPKVKAVFGEVPAVPTRKKRAA